MVFFPYFTSSNGLICVAYKDHAFQSPFFPYLSLYILFAELLAVFPILPCVSQFCAFPQPLYSVLEALFLTLCFSMDYFLQLRHTSSSSLSKTHLSHLFFYEVFPEFLFQEKPSALFVYTYSIVDYMEIAV